MGDKEQKPTLPEDLIDLILAIDGDNEIIAGRSKKKEIPVPA